MESDGLASCGHRGGRSSLLCLLFFLLGISLLAGSGCDSTAGKLHPVFHMSSKELQRSIELGRSRARSGKSVFDPSGYKNQKTYLRVNDEITLVGVMFHWPYKAVAEEIAKGKDGRDAAVQRAVRRALKKIDRDLPCTIVVQIPANADPEKIVEFSMRTNLGVEYPPMSVETPVLMEHVTSYLDPSKASFARYAYLVHFPVRGGPGFAPIGPGVSSLELKVKAGNSCNSMKFRVPGS